MVDTVLIGEFTHESNTFSTEPTTREHFRERREYFGDEIVDELRGTNTAIGGAIDVADGSATSGTGRSPSKRGGDVELLPTVAASANPGGVVTAEAYGHYTGAILDGAREHADDIDGVFLALHGAMVPEGKGDGEGPLLADVRGIVGDVPIVATFDPHGNVTDAMLEHADALVAYETYPHVDMAESAHTAMGLLEQFATGDADPVMHAERPPLLPAGPTQNTREGPMAEIMARARELEECESVLKVNVFFSYFKADVPEMGMSIPVVADDDPAAAKAASRDLAATIWERREDFVADYPDASEGVARAKVLAAETDGGPIVLADTGDNPGGGAAADGTVILRELLEQSVENAGFALVRDPDVVEQCVDAGVGERVTVTLGGKTDDRHGEPIAALEGYVKAITDGKFRNTGPMRTGTRNDLGRAIRFECGVDDGVTVIVTENRLQPLDAEIWRHMGVPPERLDVIVVKSTNHYRADYEPMASETITLETPGLNAFDPGTFDYEHIPRPKFPLDDVPADAYPDWDEP